MLSLKNVRLESQYVPLSYTRTMDDTIYDMLLGRGKPLRLAVVRAEKRYFDHIEADIEVTMAMGGFLPFRMFERKLLRKKKLPKKKPVIMHVIPTGIGAAIGGALGDAMPVNKILAHLGLLVTHPNTCNGGPLNAGNYESGEIMYVEGGALTNFSKGHLFLEPVTGNRIGVIIDRGKEDQWALSLAQNAVKHCRSHFGFPLVGIEITEKPVGGKAIRSQKSGVMLGEVENIETVIEAGARLISQGAQTLAVFTFIEVPLDYWLNYFAEDNFDKDGGMPNPVGTVEAFISHILSRYFGIPAAHAPLLCKSDIDFLQSRGLVKNDAAAGDAATPYYIPSVLRGLHYAPRFVSNEVICEPDEALHFSNVSVLVCPATAMGGIPMMRADASAIPIIGIKENKTVLHVTAAGMGFKHALEVDNYLEAFGLLALAKEKDDYSFRGIKELFIESKKLLYDIGKKLCDDCGIDPGTLRRPYVS